MKQVIRRNLLLSSAFLFSFIALSCGVPREQYDLAVGDLDKANASLSTLQTEHDRTKNELAATLTQRETLSKDLDQAKSSLATSLSEKQNVQKDYDKTRDDLIGALSKNQTLQGEYDKAKINLADALAKSKALQGDYDKAKGESLALQAQVNQLEQVQTEYKTSKAALRSMWSSLDPKLDLLQSLIAYWAAASAGDRVALERMSLAMGGFVERVGDTELSQSWVDFLKLAAQGQQATSLAKFAELMTRANKLTETDIKDLEARLAN